MPHAPDLSGLALDGRYELHDLIGEGAFGRVYRGRDRRLARPVAVKVIKPWWAEDPDWVQSFEREAQLLARVSDPGIVQIFDVGHAREGLYYVAELVDGESLASRLRRGPLSPPEARDVAEQLCRALGQAHAQRIVHRDIKPANVLISARGRVKVGDFGVARLAEGTTDGAAATIVGTPRYMAPEQARGRPTTPATDVYSVGIVLYEMLAGRPPFLERSAVELALRHLQDAPAPLPERTPQALVEIVERALSKSPVNRYGSGGEMADVLSGAGASVAAQAVGAQAQVAAQAVPRQARSAGREAPAGGVATAAPARRVTRAAAIGQESEDTSATAATALLARTPEPIARTPEPIARTPEPIARTPEPIARTPEPIARTRVGEPMTPRRNVNPAARRRRGAALGLVLAILIAMIAAAILIGSVGHVRVPNLRGLRRAAITATARRLNLHAALSARYSGAPLGVAIAQRPGPGTRVRDGATVQVLLSAGPAPVTLPALVGSSSADAQAVLRQLGLRADLMQVPAPGVDAGMVTREAPRPGASLLPGATVALSVAEAPRWRPLTSFAADGQGRSVPFRIRGSRWRVVYSMNYVGTCTFILFCSGPSADVARLSDPVSIQFGLGTGGDQTRIFRSGPGLFQISVTPGSDTARWSMEVEDYY